MGQSQEHRSHSQHLRRLLEQILSIFSSIYLINQHQQYEIGKNDAVTADPAPAPVRLTDNHDIVLYRTTPHYLYLASYKKFDQVNMLVT